MCGTTGCSPLTIPQATWSGTFNFTVGVCPNAAPLSGSHPAVCYQATGSGTGTIAQYDSNGSQTCTKSITWSIGPADADGAWIESDSSGVYHLYYSLETTNYVEPSGACSGNTQIEPDGYVLWQHLHPGQGDDVGPDVFTLGQAGQSQSGQADTGDGTTSPGFSADATFTFSY